MSDHRKGLDSDKLIDGVITAQLEHFRHTSPPCRGLQLPDGVILRYTQAKALYFYLRTAVENGMIRTQVFASDSPYDRQKAGIGAVGTPRFDPCADNIHLRKVEALIRSWVSFVEDDPDSDRDFQSFALTDWPR